MKKETYELALEFMRIGQRAVDKTREENRRLGLPNVCSRNGKLYYELPNGTMTMEDPFENEDFKSKPKTFKRS